MTLAGALPVPDTPEAAALIIGAIVGVAMKALRTTGQNPLSRETGQDAFLGVVLAALWASPPPVMSTIYPPFKFADDTPLWIQSLIFAGGVWFFLDMAKGALQNWAPKMFAKYTGQELPKDPPKETKP